MKKTTLINKLDIQRSHMSFILPIGHNKRKKKDLAQTLKQNGYSYFQINENQVKWIFTERELSSVEKNLSNTFFLMWKTKFFQNQEEKMDFIDISKLAWTNLLLKLETLNFLL